MDTAPKVLGIGCCTLDVLIRIRTLPTWEQPSGFEEIGFDGGGQAATAMAAAARLGVPAAFIGTAGNDDAADIKLRSLVRCGVDIRCVARRQKPDDSVVIVFVNARTGERMFLGGGRQGSVPLRIEELDRGYVTAADYLLLDGLHGEAALAAADWMHEAGKMVVLDAGSPRGRLPESRLAILSHVDVVIGGARFAQAATGREDVWDAGAAVLELGPRVCVQTEGSNGCYTVTATEKFHTPAFPVEVVDTTGAGDVFHGAYVVGLVHGWDLRRTARFASAVSALKCTRLGGRAGIPTFTETMSFLQSREAS